MYIARSGTPPALLGKETTHTAEGDVRHDGHEGGIMTWTRSQGKTAISHSLETSGLCTPERGLSQRLPEGVLGLSWKGRLDDVAAIWAQGRQDGVGILLLDHKEQR